MNKTETYYETLLSKYFSGEASNEVVNELSEWVNKDASNKELFEEYSKSWSMMEKSVIDSSIDPGKEWTAFSERFLGEDDQGSRTVFWSRYSVLMRVAAAIIILMIPAYFIFNGFLDNARESLMAESSILESVLPDGTEITLNRGAVLEYPSNFKGNTREVSLEGEAFFDVAHNESKAFIISSGDLRIKVLGTSFYVNTDQGKAEVILSSGKLAVYYNDNPDKPVILEPGDKASTLNSEGLIVKVYNEDRNFLSWKTKRFEFIDTPLEEIMELLSRVYQKEIVILDPEIRECRITATFNKQSLEAVLNVIQSTIEINVKPNGPGIEISGNGCQ